MILVAAILVVVIPIAAILVTVTLFYRLFNFYPIRVHIRNVWCRLDSRGWCFLCNIQLQMRRFSEIMRRVGTAWIVIGWVATSNDLSDQDSNDCGSNGWLWKPFT